MVVASFIALLLAAALATGVVVAYSRHPWRSTHLGRILMLQEVSLALVLDGTLLMQFWQPTTAWLILAVNVTLFGLIAVSEAGMLKVMWAIKRRKVELDGRKLDPQQQEL